MSRTKDLCDEIDALKEEIMELKKKLEAAEERAELAEQKLEELMGDNERQRAALRDVVNSGSHDQARAIAKEALK